MRIYTKTGDKGMTRIIGGSKVSKDNIRIDAYGTLDELNSLIGYTITTLGAEPEIQAELEQIQQQLFDAGGDLATEEGKRAYKLTSEPVAWLEDRIDIYADEPPEIEKFILPGGTQAASLLHMARTVTRRAEREIVGMLKIASSNEEVLKYVNRLSDYFLPLPESSITALVKQTFFTKIPNSFSAIKRNNKKPLQTSKPERFSFFKNVELKIHQQALIKHQSYDNG